MKKSSIALVLLLLILSCKKDPSPPEKAVLILPAKDEACLQHGPISQDGKSLVKFEWNAATNADSYELVIKNLLTGMTIVQTTSTNNYELMLSGNTPFSWQVISKSSKTAEMEKSEIWKFYHSGAGIVSYAPFPAEAIKPIIGEKIGVGDGKLSLAWNASDVDNDIVGYDVYFGTEKTPILYRANVTTKLLTDLSIISGATYYWRIITKDFAGNTSDSGLLQFSTY